MQSTSGQYSGWMVYEGSIRRSIANFKIKMTFLRTSNGTATAYGREIGQAIHDFHFDLLDSHVHLPS